MYVYLHYLQCEHVVYYFKYNFRCVVYYHLNVFFFPKINIYIPDKQFVSLIYSLPLFYCDHSQLMVQKHMVQNIAQ